MVGEWCQYQFMKSQWILWHYNWVRYHNGGLYHNYDFIMTDLWYHMTDYVFIIDYNIIMVGFQYNKGGLSYPCWLWHRKIFTTVQLIKRNWLWHDTDYDITIDYGMIMLKLIGYSSFIPTQNIVFMISQ